MALYKMVDNERIKLTAEEEAELEQLRQEADLDFTMVRADRNAKLMTTDWTQLSDAPVTEAKKNRMGDIPARITRLPGAGF